MASRRDLFQSYQFMVQRVVSGVVMRETDPAQTPLRRMGGAAFGSVMVAVLALAVAGVIGVISPGGNTSWQEQGKVIIEEESGARYVWVADDAGVYQLHPVTNFASAALIVGTSETVSVSRTSLADAPRGPRLGLAQAPDSLPEPDRVLGAPWTLCSFEAETRSGDKVPNTALVIGRDASDGSSLEDRAVLVRDVGTGRLHLVWHGHQYLIADESVVLEGLAWSSVPQIDAGTAWLNALPAGTVLGPITVAGAGSPSAAVPGATVGSILFVQAQGGQERQYYLVQSDRLEAVTAVQASIQLADPDVRALVFQGGNPAAQEISAGDVTNVTNRVPLPAADPSDPPAEQPQTVAVDPERTTLCGSFGSNTTVPRIAVSGPLSGVETGAVTERQSADGTVFADQVIVPAGRMTVVESMISGTADRGGLNLVTDNGLRYVVPSEEVLATLGYADVPRVQMPASLVARIPAGDVLTEGGAKQVG